ncbi:hypothetical protein [Pseudoalteromonas luteoviolacea]|uniref:Uncharacterized protein n=1 Tax=Pseudoalteromonas luteoviolacea NCIMB 1942 TaxID=1365253 RepID=A0A167BBX6_9GAMM|nr:hypothetical protein [Pseudoalteromonas luteoviolacea]KZN46356.1 hypothetical protein N482_12690 [Pseudoalteromonas luteoviolacea NCIMB 1942]
MTLYFQHCLEHLYLRRPRVQKWTGSFGYPSDKWRVQQHPRMMADVNGDGTEGFANASVYVAPMK